MITGLNDINFVRGAFGPDKNLALLLQANGHNVTEKDIDELCKNPPDWFQEWVKEKKEIAHKEFVRAAEQIKRAG